MSNEQNYYVFTAANFHAVTNDPSGSNLPTERYPDGWKFSKKIVISPDDKGRIGLDVPKALADIKKQGYHIVEVKVTVTEKMVPPSALPPTRKRMGGK